MNLDYKLWLEHEGKVLYGQGRQELLAAVQETGSLAGAAQKLGMGYRAAWGRLKASEERLGFALLEHGNQGRRSTSLTPQALELLAWYQELETSFEDLMRRMMADAPRFLKAAFPDRPGPAPLPPGPEEGD